MQGVEKQLPTSCLLVLTSDNARERICLDILIFSLNATMPVVLCMILGIVSRRAGLLDLATATKVIDYVFQILLPTLLFYNIYNVDFAAEFSPRLVLFAFFALLGLITVLCLIFFPLMKDKAKAAALIHISFRSNYTIFGLMLVQNMYGQQGQRIAAMLLPVVLIVFNIATVILLSSCKVQVTGSMTKTIRDVCVNLLKNPLIIASVVGTIISVSPLTMPFFIYSAFRSVAQITAPLSLIILGALLDIESLRSNVKTVIAASSMRLIFVPLVMLSIAVWAGFRGAELAALFALFASPVASAAAVMAIKFDAYPILTTQTLAMTTTLAGFTNFIGISILRYLQLF